MKTLAALSLAGAVLCTTAQSAPQSDTLQQTEYHSPRGDLIVRWGQPAARPAEPKPAFTALDRNSDGRIDEAEAAAYPTLANDFEYADHDRDHRVSRREFDRW